MPEISIVRHPLVQHKLTIMRDKLTPSIEFRRLLREISVYFAYEATKDIPLGTLPIETPICAMQAPVIEQKIILISILRAGNGILDGMLDVIPTAKVGHIGLYRDPISLQPVEYYFKVPQEVEGKDLLLIDPMLATGNSAIAATTRLLALRPRSIRFICLVASPEGVAAFHRVHPTVPILTAAVDRGLNEHSYIVPGLGDAGDRIYGTK